MTLAVILTLLAILLMGFFFLSFQKLVSFANQRFEAWGNLQEQQQKLLDAIASLVELTGKQMSKEQRTDLIEATKHLLSLEDTQIEAIGDAQQSLMLDLLACLDDLPQRIDKTSDFNQWMACQDEIVSTIDDIYLAQHHYNTATTRYNQWLDQLWVFWMADYFKYRTQPLIKMNT